MGNSSSSTLDVDSVDVESKQLYKAPCMQTGLPDEHQAVLV
jgi:hypothetical protein